MRKLFGVVSFLVVTSIIGASFFVSSALFLLFIAMPLIAIGIFDMLQTKHSIRRNFPIIGNFRYLFESIRPEINQYFVESDTDGLPFSRVLRSIIYQRAKAENDTVPFGTKLDVYSVGYQWVNHSLDPKMTDPLKLRLNIGGVQCSKPYHSSILNISAMSFGSLSKNAILALNKGAKMGGFAQDTGEGGLTKYHLEHGGDIIWEIGTGYFGCRTRDGKFDAGLFKEKAGLPEIKMIEIKLSQGAKPGHGGILPANKLTQEIADIRGVPMGFDVISPPAHSAFKSPLEMMEFVQILRDHSQGKPVGIKLCLGKRREFISMAKAMVDSRILPDFIVIDGGEGGTGAAPLEFSNYVGTPLKDALVFIHNCLVGFDLRKDIKVGVSGKVVTGFDIVDKLALGADFCNSARAMMMALGCIQALRCHSNKCPTGVATQDPRLVKGLDVGDKGSRVFNYHSTTLKSLSELLGSMGLESPNQVRPWHVMTRVSRNETKHYGEVYKYVEPGAFLEKKVPESMQRAFNAARPDSWQSSQDLEMVA